tara:strand:+ start:3367 stop:4527 length:1161 start_codon:yes stop_codon:yes gene_type:complete
MLSILLTAFGVMMALLVIQFGNHIHERLSKDGQNIDIVIGAKGSPLQIILSSVYHIDIPTGNITYDSAQKWMKHKHVKYAIPLALGDNFKGYRIVGTTPQYIEHYKAELQQGMLWSNTYEAVIGSSVGLKIGDEFTGSHGLMDGGHQHKNKKYRITGILKPTGTVLDRLILTSLDSVLDTHGQKKISEHHHDHDHDHDHDDHNFEKPEITAILIKTKNPIANINLPRTINRDTSLQAANPALEMARLSSILGVGSKSFVLFSGLLIIIAALNISAGLAASLENRLGDIAVLRAIGFTKKRIYKIITAEGMLLTSSGIILGLILGVTAFKSLGLFIEPLKITAAPLHFSKEYLYVIITVLIAGFIATIIPALRASRVDIAHQLSRNI